MFGCLKGNLFYLLKWKITVVVVILLFLGTALWNLQNVPFEYEVRVDRTYTYKDEYGNELECTDYSFTCSTLINKLLGNSGGSGGIGGSDLSEKDVLKSLSPGSNFSSVPLYVGVLTAIYMYIYFCTGKRKSVVKNKLSSGISRFQMYMADFLTSVISYLVFMFITMITKLVVFKSLNFPNTLDGNDVMRLCFYTIVLTILVSALVVLMSGVSQKYSLVALILVVIVAISLYWISGEVGNKIYQPEYLINYQILKENPDATFPKNPNYVSGFKRIIYQAYETTDFYNLVVADWSKNDEIEYVPTAYSFAFWSVILCGSGIVVYKKMEIN